MIGSALDLLLCSALIILERMLVLVIIRNCLVKTLDSENQFFFFL